MLETIREFATERLEASGEAQEIRRAHADYFRALAEEAEPHLVGEEQKEWLDILGQDHGNLKAALDWGLRDKPSLALRMSGQLWRFWRARGYLEEGRRRLRQALTVAPPENGFDRAEALRGAGTLAQVAGDLDEATHLCEQALLIYEALTTKTDNRAVSPP